MPFLKFFRTTTTTDGLSQAEREAIADLLHFCMYADNHLALAEDSVIDDAVAQMGWDPAVSFETFESHSIAKARAAKDDVTSRESFLKSLRERLASKPARARAIALCTKLFSADGTSDKESTVLAELKRILA
jgi:uncharacterized tellurite resistance protein B-like protein